MSYYPNVVPRTWPPHVHEIATKPRRTTPPTYLTAARSGKEARPTFSAARVLLAGRRAARSRAGPSTAIDASHAAKTVQEPSLCFAMLRFPPRPVALLTVRVRERPREYPRDAPSFIMSARTTRVQVVLDKCREVSTT